MSCLCNLQPNRHLRGSQQWIPSHPRYILEDSRMMTETKVRNLLTHRCSTQLCRAHRGVGLGSCLTSKLCACLEFVRVKRQRPAKYFFDQICSGEASLARRYKQEVHSPSSVQPQAYCHHLAIAVYNNNRHLSPHIICGCAPDLTTCLRRHTSGILGSEPSLRSDMACISPWITSLGILFPRIDPCPCWSTATDCPLQYARTVSTRTKRAVFVSGVTASQPAVSVLKPLRKN
jgi:hypothetical protein